ncbi:MAG TPA: LLM class flavin-dependent oxidoreductase [Nitrososphaerales archaeon]|nr:LLM class flavin-dependent oxidoreductase [Nitrososphaerales archaeon]
MVLEMSKSGSYFGLSLNNRASVFLKNYPPTDMIKMAERAEELGFGAVWVGDSLIDSPRYEPIAILGAVAARTSRIRLGGSIIQPHFRNPIMLALSWATLDRLSGGRMILTFGIGGGTPAGVAKEAELVGVHLRQRGKAMEENIVILRKLWGGETLEHKGEVYSLSGAKIGYLPVQSPPPIWIAAGVWVPKSQDKVVLSATPGYTRKKQGAFTGAFERVARLSDGWFTIMIHPDEFREKSELISEIATKYGRRPAEIKRAVECWFNVNPDRDRARNEVKDMIEGYFANPVDTETVERWSIYGTREECLKRIEAFREAGADEIKLIMGSRDQFGMLEEVGKAILPAF